MASKPGTVEFIVEQMSVNNVVTAKKMFGEYGVYCGEKMVALVCDDELFVKPTPGGKAFLGECAEGPPYPGAKSCFIISGEKWDDRAWLSELIRLTAAELPAPKRKIPKES